MAPPRFDAGIRTIPGRRAMVLALFIVAGLAIAEKVERKKEQKRLKKARDEARYRELQMETNKRLATRDGVNATADAFAEEEEGDDDDILSPAVDDPSPPAHEDAVEVGERREREWRAQMERRRSSVASGRSGRAADTFMRMG